MGAGTAFGTFGESLQGALPDGADFLVTMPIDKGVGVVPAGAGRAASVFPSHKSKSYELARAMLGDAGGTLVLDGDLPVGKGLAGPLRRPRGHGASDRRGAGHPRRAPRPGGPAALNRAHRRGDVPGVVAFEHRRVRLRRFPARPGVSLPG